MKLFYFYVNKFCGDNQYIYQYKDHLGNVRVSFGKTSAGALEIVDANDYYPFGMNHLKSGTSFFGTSSYKNYKYNGKELQETGMYDYGARMYMSDIGRWGTVDPLAEKFHSYSPYNYVLNNPISNIDPDGMDVIETASGTTYTGADAQSAFLTLRNQLSSGDDDPGKKNPRKAGSKPAGMSEEESLKAVVTIDGKKYHKNTTNIGAVFGNFLNDLAGGDDDYFIEHKEYDPVLDKELKTGAEVGSYFIGGVRGKAGVRIFTEKMFVNNLKKLGFKELQVAVKSYSTEMNAFFKSGGKEAVSKKALQAYKELATRIVNGTGGAPAGKATEKALQIQTQRLEMINKALK